MIKGQTEQKDISPLTVDSYGTVDSNTDTPNTKRFSFGKSSTTKHRALSANTYLQLRRMGLKPQNTETANTFKDLHAEEEGQEGQEGQKDQHDTKLNTDNLHHSLVHDSLVHDAFFSPFTTTSSHHDGEQYHTSSQQYCYNPSPCGSPGEIDSGDENFQCSDQDQDFDRETDRDTLLYFGEGSDDR